MAKTIVIIDEILNIFKKKTLAEKKNDLKQKKKDFENCKSDSKQKEGLALSYINLAAQLYNKDKILKYIPDTLIPYGFNMNPYTDTLIPDNNDKYWGDLFD